MFKPVILITLFLTNLFNLRALSMESSYSAFDLSGLLKKQNHQLSAKSETGLALILTAQELNLLFDRMAWLHHESKQAWTPSFLSLAQACTELLAERLTGIYSDNSIRECPYKFRLPDKFRYQISEKLVAIYKDLNNLSDNIKLKRTLYLACLQKFLELKLIDSQAHTFLTTTIANLMEKTLFAVLNLEECAKYVVGQLFEKSEREFIKDFIHALSSIMQKEQLDDSKNSWIIQNIVLSFKPKLFKELLELDISKQDLLILAKTCLPDINSKFQQEKLALNRALEISLQNYFSVINTKDSDVQTILSFLADLLEKKQFYYSDITPDVKPININIKKVQQYPEYPALGKIIVNNEQEPENKEQQKEDALQFELED